MVMSATLPLAAAAVVQKGAISLPSGHVGASDEDRVFYFEQMVVAVKVSALLCIATKPRDYRTQPPVLLEQLVGYCAGRGAEVLRAPIRFPTGWHRQGNLEKTTGFWVQSFLSSARERFCYFERLGFRDPPVLLSLQVHADCALQFWRDALLLARALQSDWPEILTQIRPTFLEVAKNWEMRWNTTLSQAEIEHQPSADWALVSRVDRAWTAFVREYLAPFGYAMQCQSIARLL